MEHAGTIAQDQINRGLPGKPKWKPKDSMSSGAKPRVQTPPLVVPDETPRDIIARILGIADKYRLADDPAYNVIVGHVWGFQYSGAGWDDYAKKIAMEIRDTMGKIFKECRQNGFFAPRAVFRKGGKVIIFGQVVEREGAPVPDKIKPTLCYFCEDRTCEEIHNGRLMRKPEYCRRKL